MRKKKNMILIIIIYIGITFLISKLLLNEYTNTLNIIASLIFVAVLNIFIFILLINYLEIKLKKDFLGSIDYKTRQTTKRMFNNCLTHVKNNNLNYYLLAINLSNFKIPKENKKFLVKKLIENIHYKKCFIYQDNLQIYILTPSYNNIIKNLDKTIYITNQKIKLLNNLQIRNTKEYI